MSSNCNFSKTNPSYCRFNTKMNTKMKTSKNMITTKVIYLLATFIGLQFNFVFASPEMTGTSFSASERPAVSEVTLLAPVTPREANFEETIDLASNALNLADLRPLLPKEADFSDNAPDKNESTIRLAPENPREACFEDEAEVFSVKLQLDLAPVLPSEADFSDDDVQLLNQNLSPSTPVEAEFEDLV
jgi:hypothetical protein